MTNDKDARIADLEAQNAGLLDQVLELENLRDALEAQLAERVKVKPLDPDMPAQQLRMHLGEMTAQEMRTARAAIRLANSTLSALEATPPAQSEPDFSKSIADVIKEESSNGAAAGWRSCSGCHETNEGYETGHFPYSKMFGCYVGSGCSECGGIGVTWEYWSENVLKMMAEDVTPPAPKVTEALAVAHEALEAASDQILEDYRIWVADDKDAKPRYGQYPRYDQVNAAIRIVSVALSAAQEAGKP